MGQAFSFVLDAARVVFRGVEPRQLVLALLATIEPAAEWNGCQVFLDPSCEGDGGTACVEVRGHAAASVCGRLAAAFRNSGIPVRDTVSVLSPAAAEAVAEVRDGCWV